MSKPCEHKNFRAHVNVDRITDGENGPVFHYTADVRVTCDECGLPFVFEGLPIGLRTHEPTVNPSGEEARLPIRPFNPDKPLLEFDSIRFEVPRPEGSDA